jgi:decaprenylphospho-beta-D-erythro-pentofuranosid-2-ulose 2-reductase
MVNKFTRIVVIGAGSEIAQKCCENWAGDGADEIILVGRNLDKISNIAESFSRKYPNTNFQVQLLDHLDIEDIEKFFKVVSLKKIDLAFIAHGDLTQQFEVKNSAQYLYRQFEINAISPMVFAEGFANIFEQQGSGQLAIIGSVAGDRGRAVNYAYGAAKAAIATYCSGLQHRFKNTEIKVSLIKPGPTLTPMTKGMHIGPTRLASSMLVASQITAGIAKAKRIIYSPKRWAIIMLIIRILPFYLFKKIKY